MAAMASQSRKDLLAKVQRMVPPMLESFHKGQLGRVGVIGGSEDYTGAPYFSAIASAKLGCDMSHVICTAPAAAVIKTYSPNLMVHPLLRQSAQLSPPGAADTPDSVADSVVVLLPRLHALVVGPGLGRDPALLDTCARVLAAARKENVPFVLDADALRLAVDRPELVQGCEECILTPNVVEFGRLAKARGVDVGGGDSAADPGAACARLARAYGGVTIIQKGAADYISNGRITLVSDGAGGLKRSGGQGDTLTGVLGTMLAWRKAYLDGIWEPGDDEGGSKMERDELLALCAFGGSAVTRECSRLAFKEKGRSMQAGDLTDKVHEAFLNVIGEKTKL